MDRYMVRAERLMEANDSKGALDMMRKIIALHKEHSLMFPEEFHFKHSKVAMSAMSVGEAMYAVTTYLRETGRKGKFYWEALELMEDLEQLQSWFDAERTCTGKSEGTACWMELIGQPGCFVWNRHLMLDVTLTWTGECAGGQARGQGVLKWVSKHGKSVREATGSVHQGRQKGNWVLRFPDGRVDEGPFVDGKQHGNWVLRFPDGRVNEGPFVDGKQHGDWLLREADGAFWNASFLEGKAHGRWIGKNAQGEINHAGFKDGKRDGYWSITEPNGDSYFGNYVEGMKQGNWRDYRRDGNSKSEVWDNGKRISVKYDEN